MIAKERKQGESLTLSPYPLLGSWNAETAICWDGNIYSHWPMHQSTTQNHLSKGSASISLQRFLNASASISSKAQYFCEWICSSRPSHTRRHLFSMGIWDDMREWPWEALEDLQSRQRSDKTQLSLQVKENMGSVSEGAFSSFPETKRRLKGRLVLQDSV